MNQDGRAITEKDAERIQHNVYLGLYNDSEIHKLFETIHIQRRVLRDLFNFFKSEPLSRVSIAEPVRNSELSHLKELVSMEDPRPSY